MFKQFAVPVLGLGLLIPLIIWLVSGSSTQPTTQAWQSGWSSETAFHYARRAPAAVVYNNHLYLIGGIDGDGHYVQTVEYAHINSNGRLGPWQLSSDLNQGRFYNAAVASNGYLYTLGGGSGERGHENYPLDSVERAPINRDGSLGPWQVVSHMTTARRGLKLVLHQRRARMRRRMQAHGLRAQPDGAVVAVLRAVFELDADHGEWVEWCQYRRAMSR